MWWARGAPAMPTPAAWPRWASRGPSPPLHPLPGLSTARATHWVPSCRWVALTPSDIHHGTPLCGASCVIPNHRMQWWRGACCWPIEAKWRVARVSAWHLIASSTSHAQGLRVAVFNNSSFQNPWSGPGCIPSRACSGTSLRNCSDTSFGFVREPEQVPKKKARTNTDFGNRTPVISKQG
jgi:hypothetical protein